MRLARHKALEDAAEQRKEIQDEVEQQEAIAAEAERRVQVGRKGWLRQGGQAEQSGLQRCWQCDAILWDDRGVSLSVKGPEFNPTAPRAARLPSKSAQM